MENIEQAVIISVGCGSWYSKGVSRLENSLVHHGFAGKTMFWKDQLPSHSPTHEENPYAFKIYAIEEAIRQNVSILMWLDSSMWCIKNPHNMLDLISDKGVVGFRTGYNMAQTASDAALEWAGISRDEAEGLPEIASGLCGLRLDNPDGARVYEYWKEGMQLGLFRTNRLHDLNDSADPRFIHARQDQTLWSLAIHRCGLHIDDCDYVAYYAGEKTGYNPEKCCFFIGGL